MKSDNTRIYKMPFAVVYPFCLKKIEKKGRTKKELDEVVFWLTGYSAKQLQKQIDQQVDFETFFNKAPDLNKNAHKITGVICGYKIEEIKDELVQKVRYLDKLVDELARGKNMDKILRK